jgi:hypothetical protein
MAHIISRFSTLSTYESKPISLYNKNLGNFYLTESHIFLESLYLQHWRYSIFNKHHVLDVSSFQHVKTREQGKYDRPFRNYVLLILRRINLSLELNTCWKLLDYKRILRMRALPDPLAWRKGPWSERHAVLQFREHISSKCILCSFTYVISLNGSTPAFRDDHIAQSQKWFSLYSDKYLPLWCTSSTSYYLLVLFLFHTFATSSRVNEIIDTNLPPLICLAAINSHKFLLPICLSVCVRVSVCLCVYLSIYLSIYLSVYLSICCSHLEHRASVKRFVLLQFLNRRQ